MMHPLRITAVLISLMVLGGGALLLWADSGPRAKTELAQQKTYSASPASADRDTFTVMTFNLGHLAGPDPSVPKPDTLFPTHMSETVDMIQQADPDIIGLQSVDFRAARSGNVHQLDSIATRLDFAAAGQAIGWNDRYLPAAQTGPVVSGQAILSRFPLRRHVRRELAHSSSPFWRDWFSPQSLVQVTAVDIGGWPLIVMNVHLEEMDTETREEQARTVRDLYERLSQQGFPILVIGTLNGLMPSATMRPPTDVEGSYSGDETMEILLDKTTLQSALSATVAKMAGQELGTYPADDPDRMIDYILYQPEVVVPIDAEIMCSTGSEPPSDHCAVAMSFLLPRPKDKLPDERIPDERLPTLERLLGDESAN